MPRLPLLLVCVVGAACGSPPSTTAQQSPATPTPQAAPGETPVQTAAVSPAADAAGHCTLAAGQTGRTIVVDGVDRDVMLAVGSDLQQPPAIVFAWHGFGSKAEASRDALQPSTYWNDAIVVAPRGLPRTFEQFGDYPRAGWQVHAGEHGDRDLALFDAIITELRDAGCLDASRVYTTGFSNGGFFSNVLACHRGDILAAAAPVGGGGPFTQPCGPAVPVLVTHGRADKVVPFEAATQTYTHWAKHNHCDDGATPPADGCAAATGCDANNPVRMCSYDIGHRWPDGQTERVAQFLRGHQRAQP